MAVKSLSASQLLISTIEYCSYHHNFMLLSIYHALPAHWHWGPVRLIKFSLGREDSPGRIDKGWNTSNRTHEMQKTALQQLVAHGLQVSFSKSNMIA